MEEELGLLLLEINILKAKAENDLSTVVTDLCKGMLAGKVFAYKYLICEIERIINISAAKKKVKGQ